MTVNSTLPVRLYQRYVSRDFNASSGGKCHYSPSCSQYAKESIETYGLKEGSVMGFMRLMRCMSRVEKQGPDPVPGHSCSAHVRAPAYEPPEHVSAGVRFLAGAARVAGIVAGGLAAGLAGFVAGAALGGYLGATAAHGPAEVSELHQKIADKYSPDSLIGFARIERPTMFVGRAAEEILGPGLFTTGLGALGGGIAGAIGGALAIGKLGGKMTGFLFRNLTLEKLT